MSAPAPTPPSPTATPPPSQPRPEQVEINPPPVPVHKYALPRASLRFMPRLGDLKDHPTAWTFPPILAGDQPAWLRELRDLYADPLSFPASVSPQAGLLLHSLVLNLRPRIAVETGTFVGASTLWIAGALDTGPSTPPRSTGVPPVATPSTPPRGTGVPPVAPPYPRSGDGQAAAGDDAPVLHAFDQFTAVEPGPWRPSGFTGDRQSLVRERLERAGLTGRVRLHPGDSATELARARADLKAAGGVDFALIDGDHSIKGVTRDLWALEPALNTGGYIVLHDTIPEQCGDHKGPRHVVDHINQIAQGLYERCELYLSPLNYGLAVLRRIG